MEGIQTLKGSWPWPFLCCVSASFNCNSTHCHGECTFNFHVNEDIKKLVPWGLTVDFPWVTLTLTLDPVIRHTVVHHSSTSIYIPNFIEIEETFCGRTDGRTDIFPPLILLGRLMEVDLKTTGRIYQNDSVILQSISTNYLIRLKIQ